MLTEEQVARVLSNAVWCARMLPGSVGPQYANVWHSLMAMAPVDDSYPEDKRLRVYPDAALLADLDLATEWMTWLPERVRPIFWLRADGNRWRFIARQVGLTPQYCQMLWRKHAQEIIRRYEIVTYGHLRDATGT